MAVIADDLAGACDTGVEFLPVYGAPIVLVDSDGQARPDGGKQLVVWNTESRALTPADAVAKARRAACRAAGPGMRVVLKKTDSAFRGNFAGELRASSNSFNPLSA